MGCSTPQPQGPMKVRLFGNFSKKEKIMFLITIERSAISQLSSLRNLCCRSSTDWINNRKMSISSSLFGSRITLAPNLSTKTIPVVGNCNVGLVIENSSRPKKKATAHHMKTRPRKTQAWDIRRKPTVYAPLPPLPPDWTIVSESDSSDTGSKPSPALQPPLASG